MNTLKSKKHIHRYGRNDGTQYPTLSYDGKPSPDNPRTPTFVPHSGVLPMGYHRRSLFVRKFVVDIFYLDYKGLFVYVSIIPK